ncbi:pentapeptide repeat-containing protein [Candidatus Poribacteria bacterium]|nr:pentapeptide repeat-containing protein [Candidatus Poribacteria bacterium]
MYSRNAWDHLASGVMVRCCREAVEQKKAEILSDCWEKFKQRGCEVINGSGCGQNPDVDIKRLYRNGCLLLNTAQAALAAKQAVDQRDAWDRDDAWDRLVQLAREAVTLLGGQPAEEVVDRDTVEMAARPDVLVRRVYDALARLGGCVAAARYWTLYWLSEHLTNIERSLDVPVAGYDSDQGKGVLADLRLELLDHHVGAQLVEHPDMALRPLGKTLLDALHAAWQRTEQNVCWTLTVRSEDVSASLPSVGDSLSVAATVGFLLLRDGRPYDPTCLIAARVGEGDALRRVGHEKEKLEAALGGHIKHAVVAEGSDLLESEIANFRQRGLEVQKLRTVAKAVEFASGLPVELKEYLEEKTREYARKYLDDRRPYPYIDTHCKYEQSQFPPLVSEAIKSFLESPTTQVLLIVSRAGNGKTRLCDHWIYTLANELTQKKQLSTPIPIDFSGSLETPESILTAIQAPPMSNGQGDATDYLKQFIAQRKLVMFRDNLPRGGPTDDASTTLSGMLNPAQGDKVQVIVTLRKEYQDIGEAAIRNHGVEYQVVTLRDWDFYERHEYLNRVLGNQLDERWNPIRNSHQLANFLTTALSVTLFGNLLRSSSFDANTRIVDCYEKWCAEWLLSLNTYNDPEERLSHYTEEAGRWFKRASTHQMIIQDFHHELFLDYFVARWLAEVFENQNEDEFEFIQRGVENWMNKNSRPQALDLEQDDEHLSDQIFSFLVELGHGSEAFADSLSQIAKAFPSNPYVQAFCEVLSLKLEITDAPHCRLRQLLALNEFPERVGERVRDFIISNLHDVSLAGMDLSTLNLSGMQFPPKMDLRRAILHDVNLHGAALVEARLEGAQLQRVIAKGADLQGAIVDRADLTEADLSEANLRGARLKGTILQKTTFMGAKLDLATITTLLDQTVFRNATLQYTQVGHSTLLQDPNTWPDVTNADLFEIFTDPNLKVSDDRTRLEPSD